MVHAGCVFVAGIHLSRTWMSGSFESVWWNTCVHRLELGLYSHPKYFWGNGVRNHATSIWGNGVRNHATSIWGNGVRDNANAIGGMESETMLPPFGGMESETMLMPFGGMESETTLTPREKSPTKTSWFQVTATTLLTQWKTRIFLPAFFKRASARTGCKQTDIVIMDFAKAFDKVNHSLLLHKLHHYGVRGQVNRWIGDFLQDQKQPVVVDSAKSNSVAVKSGVSHGSVLGPSLFLVYINDLPSTVSSPMRLFADDTAIHRPITSGQDQTQIQNDLQQLQMWEKSWDMSFHYGKCTTLTVISPMRMKKLLRPSYQLHNHTLANVTLAEYLGVTIAQDLDWGLHVHITIKATRTLGFLRRNLKVNNIRLKETAYKAKVWPVSQYAYTVWGLHKDGQITKIKNVQRRPARFALNQYKWTTSVTNLLNHFGWTSLQSRRKIARLTMMYKITNSMVQVDFGRLHKTKEQKLQTPTKRDSWAHSKQLAQVQCLRDYRRYSFLPWTIPDWNDSLTEAVTGAMSLDVFTSGACKLHQ